jgi:hypothetical protein
VADLTIFSEKRFFEMPGTARVVISDRYRREPDQLKYDIAEGMAPPSDRLMLVTTLTLEKIKWECGCRIYTTKSILLTLMLNNIKYQIFMERL